MARNTTRAVTRARSSRAAPLLVLAAVACSSSAANEWDFSADLFTGLTFTDNVILVPEDGEDEYIWEISPTIIASRDGKRVDVDFNYRLQGLLYAREDRRNEAYNFLQSTLQADVVPEWLKFDADASISQTVIDPLIASGNSSISTSGNTAETLIVNASPYILRRLGAATVLRAGVSAGIIKFDDDMLIDNTQQNTFATITNSGGSGVLNWSFGYNSTLVEYDTNQGFLSNQEIELARVNGELGLRISPRTELVVSGGEDFNDFGGLPGTRVAEGTFWNVGFRGGFGDNVDFDVRVGEQFFGDSYSVQFSRKSRALVSSISYNEEATTIGAQQLDFSNALNLLGLAGNLNNQFDVNGFDLPQRDPELYIRRRMDFNNTLSSGSSTWNLGIYYEDRSFIRTANDGDRENVQGARFEWAWEFDRSTSVRSSATYQKLNSRDNVSVPQDLRVSVQVRRELAGNSYIQGSIWRNQRRAPQALTEFQENALRIGFGRRF